MLDCQYGVQNNCYEYAPFMLTHILLGFLNYGPMTGYELKSVMDHSTQHFWHAQHSQIYTTLRKLREQGLVWSEEPDEDDPLNRRVYHLTDAGRAELQRWLSQPQIELDQIKHEMLVRVFFSGSRNQNEVIEEFRLQRRLHQQQLDYYKNQGPETWQNQLKITPEVVREIPFWLSTLEFGMAYEEMVLAWLDRQIAQLEAGSST